MKNIKTIYWQIFLFLVLLPSRLLANEHDPDPGDSGGSPQPLDNPTNIDSISDLLDRILDFVVTLGTPVVTIAIIYAGFKFVYAQGKPEEIKKAKATFLYVLIGAAIILGAFVLKTVITGTVGQIQSGL